MVSAEELVEEPEVAMEVETEVEYIPEAEVEVS